MSPDRKSNLIVEWMSGRKIWNFLNLTCPGLERQREIEIMRCVTATVDRQSERAPHHTRRGERWAARQTDRQTHTLALSRQRVGRRTSTSGPTGTTTQAQCSGNCCLAISGRGLCIGLDYFSHDYHYSYFFQTSQLKLQYFCSGAVPFVRAVDVRIYVLSVFIYILLRRSTISFPQVGAGAYCRCITKKRTFSLLNICHV